MILLALSLLFSGLTIYLSTLPTGTIHARAVTGAVNLYITGAGPSFTIHSPLNTTYNFAIGSNRTLDLNISSAAIVDSWHYTLEDLTNSEILEDNVPFTPNISFIAARGSNRLTVYATDAVGGVSSKSVIFFVSVPNSAPLLGNITPTFQVCEAASFSYNFNATDADADDLLVSLSPTNPFFVFPTFFSGQAFIESQLFSGPLPKSALGVHELILSVTDGQYSDSQEAAIEVVERNNPVVVEDIGVQTLYLQGQNSILDRQISSQDTEDGSQNSTFNISFKGGPTLFSIAANGSIYFDPNATHVGVHNITYCAIDSPLADPHPDIVSVCGQDGSSQFDCSDFTITVTDQNRPPTIVAHSPLQTTVNMTGGQTIAFNITTFDPDGTIPDVRWYVDNGLALYVQNSSSLQYLHTFGCGVDGNRKLEAVITDGIANDSISWNISLTMALCPTTEVSSGGGGGGGGGGPFCAPKWGCDAWEVCQNTQASLEIGVIGQLDYRQITEGCAAMGLDERNCGYQTRGCFDGMMCNSSVGKPDFMQACIYTSNPSCSDGIKNCHDGDCELLVDCGGPCGQCPSCSDGLQNQGELDIDCGGPCPFVCPVQTPLVKASTWRTVFVWSFWLILLILLLILIRRIWRLIEVHRELQKEKRIQSALSR